MAAIVLRGLQAAVCNYLRKTVRPQDFPIMDLRVAMVCESLCLGPEPQLLGLERLPFDWIKLTAVDEHA